VPADEVDRGVQALPGTIRCSALDGVRGQAAGERLNEGDHPCLVFQHPL
jgi:hypothetical protein